MGVAIAMGAMAGGSALFGSLMGGQQQVAQNAIQRLQFEEQEFQRKSQNHAKNRQIAVANAAKWMANKKLAKAANKARAEEEFWLGYNFDNAVGQFSRDYRKMNAGFKGAIGARGMDTKSGSARQIMKSSLTQGSRGLVAKRVSHGNAMVSADRRHKSVLSKRDYGYASNVAFMPGQIYQVSDSSIMSSALTSGLITGISSGISTGVSTQMAMSDAGWGADSIDKKTGADIKGDRGWGSQFRWL